jgi:predicted enzyme related to lactoylglutathione lyase
VTHNFIWYELLTTDPDAAASFYGAVLGWTATNSEQPGMDYRIFNKLGTNIGGLMALPRAAIASGMQPSWLGYISVADVDQSVDRIVAAGGALHMPAMSIAGVGRIAMVADPQGASFYVMTPFGSLSSTSFAPGKPGHGGWHELRTSDWVSALAFYGEQFGWQKVNEMSIGALGSYLQFNFGSGAMVGGMRNDSEATRPYWLYVFNVGNINAAHRQVTANGGQTLHGPHQVPTGDWVIFARDPQGARFALVGPSR